MYFETTLIPFEYYDYEITVPIDQDVRDGLERRTRSLGFDSAQAYVRVWAKAEADGRKLDFDGRAVILSSGANARYEQMIAELEADKKAGKLKEFTSVEDFMKDL